MVKEERGGNFLHVALELLVRSAVISGEQRPKEERLNGLTLGEREERRRDPWQREMKKRPKQFFWQFPKKAI